MSTFDYVGLRAEAEELLEEFGRAAVLRNTEADNSEGVENHPVTVVLANYTQRERDSGNMIGFADRKAIVSTRNLSVLPDSESYVLLIAEQEWRVLSVNKIEPAETTLLYVMQVRR